MCLLIVKNAATRFTKEDLADYLSKNGDGAGVMLAENGMISVTKILAKTVEELVDFMEPFQEKACVWHLRMRTHGVISLAQVHPYCVLDAESGHEMWLMHNGILHTGNAQDTTKSDTDQYIRTHLRNLLDPRLGGNPELIFNPVFQEILGDAIGQSNKFVIMDYTGRTAIINEGAFVEHKNSLYSNTYAWDSGAAGFGYKPKASVWNTKYTTTPSQSRWDNYEDDTETETDLKNEMKKEIDLVFQSLNWGEFEAASDALGEDTIRNYIEINGSDDIWDAIDLLDDSLVTEDEFIVHVRRGSTKRVQPMQMYMGV